LEEIAPRFAGLREKKTDLSRFSPLSYKGKNRLF